MRDWKRWTAVLLAGSLAFTAADDMKLIVQAYEMQNEQGQESYQAESKSKLDDLKEKAVLFPVFQNYFGILCTHYIIRQYMYLVHFLLLYMLFYTFRNL